MIPWYFLPVALFIGFLLGVLVSELGQRKLHKKLDEVKANLAEIEQRDSGLGAKVKAKKHA